MRTLSIYFLLRMGVDGARRRIMIESTVSYEQLAKEFLSAGAELDGLGKQLADARAQLATLEKQFQEASERYQGIGRSIMELTPVLVGTLPSTSVDQESRTLHSQPSLVEGKGTLKDRVLVALLNAHEPLTVEEIAAVISEPDPKRVGFCVRDLRAKNNLLDKPIGGTWVLNAAGKKEASRLQHSM
jgi:hypothetical protein